MVIEKNVKLYAKSGTSKKGNPYYQLYVDLGYRKIALAFDVTIIAEIFGMSVAECIDKLNKEDNK